MGCQYGSFRGPPAKMAEIFLWIFLVDKPISYCRISVSPQRRNDDESLSSAYGFAGRYRRDQRFA
jgi:hypothetical protein